MKTLSKRLASIMLSAAIMTATLPGINANATTLEINNTSQTQTLSAYKQSLYSKDTRGIKDVNKKVNDVKSQLKSNGVKAEKIDNLIEKLKKGETWDSFNGAEPINVTEEKEGNVTTTRKDFEDGSFAISYMEEYSFPDDVNEDENEVKKLSSLSLRQARTIDNVGIRGGDVDKDEWHTTVTNCTVYLNLAAAELAFKASYTINKGKYNDEILRAYRAPYVSYTGVEVEEVNKKENSIEHARAQVSGHPIWFPTATTILYLDVGSNRAVVDLEDD
ncbi:hypothetical protein FDA33_10210 [Clostridium botulinum]|uniref:Uncharacterized protein n=1 Tax=Clostridium botulinum TaxID=1491 RepID=A0A126JHU7_CLOBO|nr:hypothetical protein [Clostridium botulinum]ALT05375.1 hypothetical protein [Clostridium botulinum]NFH90563.1 hypothetical protein [Clostridium botulinum]NFI17247.1 hypothetical protein [Clostridium botulinum]NFN52974.1 hypothetical protein [Clostridium botulinum]NFO35044.1 hypothetical protein [Clostridium botulinum]